MEAQNSSLLNGSNGTPDSFNYDDSRLTPVGQLILSISLVLSGSLSIAGNIINLLVIHRVTSFKRNMKLYLSTLSVADLTTGVFVASSAILGFFVVPRSGTVFCAVSGMALSFSPYLSSLCLSKVAIDKFLLIKYPFKYRNLRNIPLYYILVDLLLAWSILLWIANFDGHFFGNVTYQPLYGMCLLNFHNRQKWTSIATAASTGMGLHMVITVCLYFSIAATAHNQAKRINSTIVAVSGASEGEATGRMAVANPWKGFSVFLMVTVAFFVAWLSFWLSQFLLLFTDFYILIPIYVPCGFCTIANSWWNPIIYTLWNREFRKHFKKLVRSVNLRLWSN